MKRLCLWWVSRDSVSWNKVLIRKGCNTDLDPWFSLFYSVDWPLELTIINHAWLLRIQIPEQSNIFPKLTFKNVVKPAAICCQLSVIILSSNNGQCRNISRNRSFTLLPSVKRKAKPSETISNYCKQEPEKNLQVTNRTAIICLGSFSASRRGLSLLLSCSPKLPLVDIKPCHTDKRFMLLIVVFTSTSRT